MNAHEILSEDGAAVLAMCSGLGLKEQSDGLTPLKLSQWNELEKALTAAKRSPASLHGLSVSDLVNLGVDQEEAKQIARLLDRGGRLALELERLFSAGIWAVTRVDELYPGRLSKTLKQQAPSVLFGSGDINLLRNAGVAIVGSRHIDETAAEFARLVGRKAVESRLAVVSGGAKGSDAIGMEAALEKGGVSMGALADSLERTIRQADVGEYLRDGRLVLITPYVPNAGFSIGGAMGRNKLIYGLSDYAVVISSDFQTGGTWAGATEALKANWCPVFVRSSDSAPKGNAELIKLGAAAMPCEELANTSDLRDWLETHAPRRVEQAELF
ncbi:MAG: DNA-processing protein DprA [Verrucomicrobia subdivision 3 bacterium]|nr:DNA-processing protein DprA [Limisphaerales bacterium]